MTYNKILLRNGLYNYLCPKYNLDRDELNAVLTIGGEKYFLEITYNGIWYSISNYYTIIIQEHNYTNESRIEIINGTSLGLTREEFFNLSMTYPLVEFACTDHINEIFKFISNELLPACKL